jgi:beta-lactamase class D
MKAHFLLSLTALSLAALLLLSCAPTQPAAPTDEIRPDWEKQFQTFNVKGAFVVYDLNRQHYLRYNPARCDQRFIPASTFKIMNALVGLETGVIPTADYTIKWDGTHYDIPAWNHDHTLRTAMQNSVVWYYQELARRVGPEKMQYYIDAANYGNRNISGPLDSFWLDGGLSISPNEQIEFLKRLYAGKLPFSSQTMDTVKDIMVLEKATDYTLRGKVGWGQRIKPQIGWFVGYLEEKDNVYFFATNIESDAPDQNFGEAREKITRTIFHDLGLLP